VKQVVVSPDSLLDLVPFAELRTAEGLYWIKQQGLRVVRTGRDLLPSSTTPTAKPNGLVAFGGIDYQRFADSEPKPAHRASEQDLIASRQLLGDQPRIGIPEDNSAPEDRPWAYSTLKATDAKARQLFALYRQRGAGSAQLLTGTHASEAQLKAMQSAPRILHLATHGFFRAQRQADTQRPLTLSGLAMAGANQGIIGGKSPNGDDGILYALEVQDLNLAGTELVTLSACDTGQGIIDNTEGVFGLVRAFQLAGANRVLMTLWQLNDTLAVEFMADFHRAWLGHKANAHTAEALRATQLAWINSDDTRKRDPHFWAPYVLVERE
jgi:CHAT domain-containing protein